MTRKPERHKDLARRIEEQVSMEPGLVAGWLEHNARFRALCEEYDECQNALRRWQAMAETHKSQAKEFETLAHELEEEIRGFLAEREDGPG